MKEMGAAASILLSFAGTLSGLSSVLQDFFHPECCKSVLKT